MTVDLDRLSALLDDALPGTWVAVNRQGEIRVVAYMDHLEVCDDEMTPAADLKVVSS